MRIVQIGFVHIRHATSILKIGDREILIDPMLSAKESLPPVILTGNKLKNPLTDLPVNPDTLVKTIDYLLLSHLHFDHFDQKAIEIISKDLPVLCSKTDVQRLNDLGFLLTRPIENQFEIGGIKITGYPATHGRGLLKFMMGSSSSYLIDYNGFKIFLTGDCLLTDSLKHNLIKTEPDVVIANGGAAKFIFGKPITMSINEIQEISGLLPKSKIFVIHLDSLNHCSETRDYCRERVKNYPNIYIPTDGEEIALS